MIKKIIKYLIISSLIFIVLVISIFIFYGYLVVKHDRDISKQVVKRFTPGTVEYETYKRWHDESKIYYEHANKAKEYEKKANYDLAIKEYKEAAECKPQEWMAHWNLLSLYEKGGYYDLAVQEINWLLAQKPSQRVADELVVRKKSLEAKLTGVKRTANIIEGVTNKDYVSKELGSPTEIVHLKDGQEAWIYKDYMDISKAMPNLQQKQPYVVIFNTKDSLVADNYITDDKSIEMLKKQKVP